jgi:hypothetical protein
MKKREGVVEIKAVSLKLVVFKFKAYIEARGWPWWFMLFLSPLAVFAVLVSGLIRGFISSPIISLFYFILNLWLVYVPLISKSTLSGMDAAILYCYLAGVVCYSLRMIYLKHVKNVGGLTKADYFGKSVNTLFLMLWVTGLLITVVLDVYELAVNAVSLIMRLL